MSSAQLYAVEVVNACGGVRLSGTPGAWSVVQDMSEPVVVVWLESPSDAGVPTIVGEGGSSPTIVLPPVDVNLVEGYSVVVSIRWFGAPPRGLTTGSVWQDGPPVSMSFNVPLLKGAVSASQQQTKTASWPSMGNVSSLVTVTASAGVPTPWGTGKPQSLLTTMTVTVTGSADGPWASFIGRPTAVPAPGVIGTAWTAVAVHNGATSPVWFHVDGGAPQSVWDPSPTPTFALEAGTSRKVACMNTGSGTSVSVLFGANKWPVVLANIQGALPASCVAPAFAPLKDVNGTIVLYFQVVDGDLTDGARRFLVWEPPPVTVQVRNAMQPFGQFVTPESCPLGTDLNTWLGEVQYAGHVDSQVFRGIPGKATPPSFNVQVYAFPTAVARTVFATGGPGTGPATQASAWVNFLGGTGPPAVASVVVPTAVTIGTPADGGDPTTVQESDAGSWTYVVEVSVLSSSPALSQTADVAVGVFDLVWFGVRSGTSVVTGTSNILDSAGNVWGVMAVNADFTVAGNLCVDVVEWRGPADGSLLDPFLPSNAEYIFPYGGSAGAVAPPLTPGAPFILQNALVTDPGMPTCDAILGSQVHMPLPDYGIMAVPTTNPPGFSPTGGLGSVRDVAKEFVGCMTSSDSVVHTVSIPPHTFEPRATFTFVAVQDSDSDSGPSSGSPPATWFLLQNLRWGCLRANPQSLASTSSAPLWNAQFSCTLLDDTHAKCGDDPTVWDMSGVAIGGQASNAFQWASSTKMGGPNANGYTNVVYADGTTCSTDGGKAMDGDTTPPPPSYALVPTASKSSAPQWTAAPLCVPAGSVLDLTQTGTWAAILYRASPTAPIGVMQAYQTRFNAGFGIDNFTPNLYMQGCYQPVFIRDGTVAVGRAWLPYGPMVCFVNWQYDNTGSPVFTDPGCNSAAQGYTSCQGVPISCGYNPPETFTYEVSPPTLRAGASPCERVALQLLPPPVPALPDGQAPDTPSEANPVDYIVPGCTAVVKVRGACPPPPTAAFAGAGGAEPAAGWCAVKDSYFGQGACANLGDASMEALQPVVTGMCLQPNVGTSSDQCAGKIVLEPIWTASGGTSGCIGAFATGYQSACAAVQAGLERPSVPDAPVTAASREAVWADAVNTHCQEGSTFFDMPECACINATSAAVTFTSPLMTNGNGTLLTPSQWLEQNNVSGIIDNYCQLPVCVGPQPALNSASFLSTCPTDLLTCVAQAFSGSEPGFKPSSFTDANIVVELQNFCAEKKQTAEEEPGVKALASLPPSLPHKKVLLDVSSDQPIGGGSRRTHPRPPTPKDPHTGSHTNTLTVLAVLAIVLVAAVAVMTAVAGTVGSSTQISRRLRR